MSWQPIETAPRDGTVILGWYFDANVDGSGMYIMAYYDAVPYQSWFDSTGFPIDPPPDMWTLPEQPPEQK